VLGFVVVFFLTMKVGASRLGFSFFETTDRGRIFIRADFPSYYNLEKTVSRLEGIQARLMDLPDLTHILTTAGKAEAFGGQPNEGVYLGQIELFFKPKTERDWKILDMLSDIRAMLATETDCLLSASVQSGMGGQSFQINYNLTGEDLDILESAANAIQEVARDVPAWSSSTRPSASASQKSVWCPSEPSLPTSAYRPCG
jgi:cobalt-zinc-cadmium resistance protein CzcA